MTILFGELTLPHGQTIIKMWKVDIPPQKRTFRQHLHTRFEISVINSGSGEYATEQKVYPICPGDVFVFSSNEVHCITKICDEGLSITNLHFEPQYLNEKDSFFSEESLIRFCFSHAPEFENRIPAKQSELLRKHHAMIRQELAEKKHGYSLSVKSHLNLMLLELLRNHNYEAAGSPKQNITLTNILPVYDYIETHLCEDLHLDRLAAIAGLSPNYFSHVFRYLNGVTLWNYITSKRIEKAVQLICHEDSSLTMLEIAMECGFNNTVNFNKAFKKQTGVTPSELKRNPKLLLH